MSCKNIKSVPLETPEAHGDARTHEQRLDDKRDAQKTKIYRRYIDIQVYKICTDKRYFIGHKISIFNLRTSNK